ncbi:Hypothetical predicted protein [Paramuricea clavata]|uniref:Uncharacterized protein n=1 Tax=Paramuricea clavata TaxID=317549 RepID=A0A7D9J7B7_PARCT|nr:Hypothetical predicted protein [Paramuricea clavata]
MGNILTYIWDRLFSLFNLITIGRDQTDEDVLSIVKAGDEVGVCEQRPRVNREVIGQSHEKSLFKLARGEYAHMVERLSTRYKLSENITSQMLQKMDNDVPCGEHPLKDENYSVLVVKRETDFDVKLFRASFTDYTRERVVCIE